jgi:hypothetical protein
VRVRDVEIALVLAREMKGAAERSVDASLRLAQLKEVFGAQNLDRAERARIQTALQMAGLEPRPSLLEADPDEPIRFAVEGTADATQTTAVAAPAQPGEQQAEFPTVGEFFRRVRGKRKHRAGQEQVTTATQVPVEPPRAEMTEVEVEPEAEPEAEAAVEEPVAEERPADEPVLEGPTLEAPLAEEPVVEEPVPEPVVDESAAEDYPNGEVTTNGHAHLDFDGGGLLDDAVLPPHDTATPADFGASAETVDYENAEVEVEAEAEAPPVDETVVAAIVEHPEADHYVPEYHEVQPETGGWPSPVWLFAAVAVPVVIASFAGWAFGLAFVALGLVATGLLRHARLKSVLWAGAAVTAASLVVSVVLSGLDSGGGDDATTTKPPAAEKPAEPPKSETPAKEKPEEPARDKSSQPDEKPKANKPEKKREPKPKPDEETEGLILVPPGSSGTGEGDTSTTPGATPTEPGATTRPSTGTQTPGQ